MGSLTREPSTCTCTGSPAARAVFEAAGIGPEEVQVAQVQDTESGAEVMHLAETGLCAHGEQEQWYADGVTEIGGRLPVNTDGGVIANGEPIGATGLRQVHEIVQQLGQLLGGAACGSPGGRLGGERAVLRPAVAGHVHLDPCRLLQRGWVPADLAAGHDLMSLHLRDARRDAAEARLDHGTVDEDRAVTARHEEQ